METEKSAVEIKKQDAGRGLATERMKTGNTYLPNVDISEDKDGIYLTADMPGVGDKDVNITLENDVLTIEGKVVPDAVEGHAAVYREYGVGDYFRSFILTEAIDRDRIEAKIKDGVLSIVLPKSEAAKPRHIPIRAS
ncbi:MAG TPA: Hsp20/alpha crystallin family protein [Deltaproteobacteria bacterium]|jgi:HSP20 family molecular chaperone IbpA|nr:Hsp20/alpha crystallin family protein [Deltaproteobacteria bacterium]HOI08304.1 Hsp20/alpha crystallin family protein [Deltaproteobacteria bacterium]